MVVVTAMITNWAPLRSMAEINGAVDGRYEALAVASSLVAFAEGQPRPAVAEHNQPVRVLGY